MKKIAVILKLVLLISPSSAVAEHQQATISLVANKSRLSVEELKPASKAFRDPTRINESFQEALKRISPSGKQQKGDFTYRRPDISLSALVAGSGQTHAAMLSIDGEVRLVKQGDNFSILSKDELIGIEILEVTADEVRFTVLPSNETITLR